MYALNMSPENVVRGIKVKPVLKPVPKLRTNTLAEFDPVLWEELSKMPVSYRVLAVRVFGRVREKCEGV